ncbi:tol-pal system protein YbgF [Pseudomarimonas salicorniae]|uniref:Cell division coordinator CpoB n=1 Tax=Pseudomarimonas salicorniae TaxID=2933270 RepID=A0ABT0GDL0_9GAMM|nr:tol-pal system protein YbgF [Lysobacter sp. CAU 1642]MCK7592639.1 tol-pal system protein YbgF [Lysobacter sp. CAU 1642]
MRSGLRKLTLGTAVLATAVAFSASAQSSRLSLAERVARLEQDQAQGNASEQTLDLLNRIKQLQTEVQSLRGLVEQQSFEIESLKKRSRDQYLDLDSRIGRIEGNPLAPDPAAAPQGVTMPDNAQPLAGPADPNVTTPTPVLMEEPEVRAPLDVPSQTAGVAGGDAAAAESIANPADERRMYESAFDALKEGRYAEAARRFQGFLNAYPNGEFAPNAHYWLGESYYVTQNYQIALDSFRTLLNRFPNSLKAPDALLKVGYCQYELRQWAEAEATLNQVVERYPDSTVSRLAQGRLRALRLEARQ